MADTTMRDNSMRSSEPMSEGVWEAIAVSFIVLFILATAAAVWFAVDAADSRTQVEDVQQRMEDLELDVNAFFEARREGPTGEPGAAS